MSEPIGKDTDVDDDSGKKTDMMAISGGVLSNINYKVGFLLFFFAMLIFSDIFVDAVLSDKMHDGAGCPNTSGTLAQITMMVFIYLLLDLVVKYEFL
jgi:hypothetical protein